MFLLDSGWDMDGILHQAFGNKHNNSWAKKGDGGVQKYLSRGEGDVRAENILSQNVWYGSQERRKLRVGTLRYVSDECSADPANTALIQHSLTPELAYW